MLLKFGSISIVLIFTILRQSTASEDQCGPLKSVLVCMDNKPVEVNYWPKEQECEINEAPTLKKFRDDYTHAPGMGWYKLHTQAKTWNDARKTCENEGAHLAVLSSKAEENFLRDMFKQQANNIKYADTTKEAFLGAHDEFVEGDWVTVTDKSFSSMDYVNWSNDNKCYGKQPDGGDGQNCAALVLNCEGMDDTHCKYSLAFFCEKPDICS